MPVWFDVTSLYSWNRPVTGVTRVELECARALLEGEYHHVQFVQFDPRSKRFSACDASGLRERLAFLDALEGHPAGRLRTLFKNLLSLFPDRTQTLLLLALSAPSRLFQRRLMSFRGDMLSAGSDSVFARGDGFITVGFDLASAQFKTLSLLRKRLDLRVMSCCHDLIPWVRPDLTLDRITGPFLQHLDELVETSDHVLCNSLCTAKDLRRYLETKSPSPAISVIRLGSRIGQKALALPSSVITSILDHPFILYVSTIERRKNHEILLDAYRELLDQGTTELPMLVLVGMRGWGAERFFKKLDADADVARFVKLLHHVGDNDLSVLYQKTLFTVYPSLYEGWGLPVAESLAYGKYCIASDAASIPEVGGKLIRYCSPGDAVAWAEAIHELATHPEKLSEAEAMIRLDYVPPEWCETVAQILRVSTRLNENVP